MKINVTYRVYAFRTLAVAGLVTFYWKHELQQYILENIYYNYTNIFYKLKPEK